MSKTWEHYHHASRHHERAAYHYKEAAKYDKAEDHEKAAHHAYLAHGHSQHAIHHDAEAAKLHAEQCDRSLEAASEQEAQEKVITGLCYLACSGSSFVYDALFAECRRSVAS